MLTTFPYEAETGSTTHTGMVRDHNEDNHLVLPDAGLWLVADGMGGHEAGEVASKMIVEAAASIGQATSAPDMLGRLVDRIEVAHKNIREHSIKLGGATIGSTVVALLCYDGHFAVIWAGDSRAYLLRDGLLHQISKDHTEAQELVAQGIITAEQALHWPRRNVITRAVGVFDRPNADKITGTIQPGDVFLLCSDGLTEHVPPPDLAVLMADPDPQAACDKLVNLTLARGAKDNVTVIVVRWGPRPSAAAQDDEDEDKTVPNLGARAGMTGMDQRTERG
jgi:serine/threonine protein phosphatase PrpC